MEPSAIDKHMNSRSGFCAFDRFKLPDLSRKFLARHCDPRRTDNAYGKQSIDAEQHPPNPQLPKKFACHSVHLVETGVFRSYQFW